MKFKIGDKVRIKKERLKWYLSEEGQDCFYPPSGKLDECQSYSQDVCNVAVMNMLLDPEILLEVKRHNWPTSESENFTVKLGDATFNVEPSMLVYRGGRRKSND